MTGLTSSMKVKITPKPIRGLEYHSLMNFCNEPGYNESGKKSVWHCPDPQDEETYPSLLPWAPPCSPDVNKRRFFNYQFQGGSVEDATLRFPHGYGFQVGGKTNIHSITGLFHFLKQEYLVNGSTAGSEMEVTLVPVSRQNPMRQLDCLILTIEGFVGANSFGTVSGSWVAGKEDQLKLLTLYAHWHIMNQLPSYVSVWIERTSGQKDLINRQDPHSFLGTYDLSNRSLADLKTGDRLVVDSAFNNTNDHNIRLQ